MRTVIFKNTLHMSQVTLFAGDLGYFKLFKKIVFGQHN